MTRRAQSADCAGTRRPERPNAPDARGLRAAHVTPAVVAGTALAFAFAGSKLLIGGDEQAPAIPLVDELEQRGHRRRASLSRPAEGASTASHCVPETMRRRPGFALAGLRSLFLRLPEPLLALARARSRSSNGIAPTASAAAAARRRATRTASARSECPACGYVAYPRMSPAMMVLVTRGREMLLARAQPLSGRDVQRARRLRRGRARRSRTASIAKCARRSASRSTRLALLRQPVMGVPAFADDRVHRAICRRRAAPGSAEIADARWFARRRAARSAEHRVHRPAADRRDGGAAARGDGRAAVG